VLHNALKEVDLGLLRVQKLSEPSQCSHQGASDVLTDVTVTATSTPATPLLGATGAVPFALSGVAQTLQHDGGLLLEHGVTYDIDRSYNIQHACFLRYHTPSCLALCMPGCL
jgi:hypothetical protein